MYKYMYIEVKVGGMFKTDEHRDIIDKYSKEGWRFVGNVPKGSGSYGQIKAIDLIFEKEYIDE
ncbi:MAG: DUF4177 domain-containing protein [Peptostreptococcaceae bacterium]